MKRHTKFKSPILQKLVSEQDVRFLLSRLHKHSPGVFHHSLRVAGLMEMLWSDVSVEHEERERLLRTTLLHDIGIIHVDRIHQEALQDTAMLAGVQILHSLIQEQRIDEQMVLYHHENLDGTGIFGADHKELDTNVRTLRIIDDFDKFSRGTYTQYAVSRAMEDLYQWSGNLYDEVWLEKFNQMMKETMLTMPKKLDEISRM